MVSSKLFVPTEDMTSSLKVPWYKYSLLAVMTTSPACGYSLDVRNIILYFVPSLKGGCVATSGVMMDLGASGRDLDGTGFSSSLIPVDLNTEPLLRPSL